VSGARVPRRRRLINSDGSFLRAPKKRQLDPFGEGLRGQLRRLVTGGDGLDNPESQECQASQTPDVVREHPFTTATAATDSTRPVSKSSAHWCPRAIALMSARSANGAGARLPGISRRISNPRRLICIGKIRAIVSASSFALCCCSTKGDRQLERNAEARIDEIHALDQDG
jgi:hypothetical protein